MNGDTEISTPGFDPADVIFQQSCVSPEMRPITSYLLALSAFRRGLAVTFLRTIGPGVAVPGFEKGGNSAELFRVSDGRREVVFNRTATNLVDPLALVRTRDKAMTKAILTRAGLRVPGGVTVRAGDHEAARAFLSASKADRFVAKPVDSSLAKGVFVDLTADEVMAHLGRAGRGRLIVEEYITGTELRVAVVGDQVAGALIRHPASVTGDGVHTIEQLTGIRTAERMENIAVRAVGGGIDLDESKRRFLAETGRTVHDIPAAGEKIVLSRYRDMVHGGDTETALHMMNDSLKRVCVAAAKAMRLAVAGIDLVISDRPETPGAFILELNARPQLSAYLMPTIGRSTGMALPDAVIDLHFPDSRANPRHRDAMFDYTAIVDAMRSTSAEWIALPRLTPEWQHLRVTFRSEQIHEAIRIHLRRAGGVLLSAIATDGQGHVLDALLSRRSRMFLQKDRTMIRKLVPTLDEAIDWPGTDEIRTAFRAEAVQAAHRQRQHGPGTTVPKVAGSSP